MDITNSCAYSLAFIFKSHLNDPEYLFMTVDHGGESLSNFIPTLVRMEVKRDAYNREIILQLCTIVHYMHIHARMTHRDLKPDNVLVEVGGDGPSKVLHRGKVEERKNDETRAKIAVKICDLGTGHVGESPCHSPGFTTISHTPPELILSTSVVVCLGHDYYALGMTILEVILGEPNVFSLMKKEGVMPSEEFTNKVSGHWATKSLPQGKCYDAQVELCHALYCYCVLVERSSFVANILEDGKILNTDAREVLEVTNNLEAGTIETWIKPDKAQFQAHVDLYSLTTGTKMEIVRDSIVFKKGGMRAVEAFLTFFHPVSEMRLSPELFTMHFME